jgi:hypothetical protein
VTPAGERYRNVLRRFVVVAALDCTAFCALVLPTATFSCDLLNLGIPWKGQSKVPPFVTAGAPEQLSGSPWIMLHCMM